jgi:hypothetical protein
MDIKYKSDKPEGSKNTDKRDKEDSQTTEVRKDKRRINQDRKTFDQDKAFNDQDLEDEGFKMTVDRNVIRRQQRGQGGGGFNRRDEDNDSFVKADNEPKSSQPQIKRGGAFGNMANDSD